MPAPDKSEVGLANVFGPRKGGSSKGEPSKGEPSSSGDFESAAVDAFPELEGKPERIAALKQAIKACVEADEAGEYEEE